MSIQKYKVGVQVCSFLSLEKALLIKAIKPWVGEQLLGTGSSLRVKAQASSHKSRSGYRIRPVHPCVVTNNFFITKSTF